MFEIYIFPILHFSSLSFSRYLFDSLELPKAHEQCQRRAEEACKSNRHVIVIDNTNISRWEMLSYFRFASLHNYAVVIVEPKTNWKFDVDRLAILNEHSVSKSAIARRLKNYETVLPIYFAWFLNEADSMILLTIGRTWLERCLSTVDEFK